MSDSEEEFTGEDMDVEADRKRGAEDLESDFEDDISIAKVAKKKKPPKEKKRKAETQDEKKSTKKRIKKEPADSKPAASGKKTKELKKLTKTERLQYAMQSFLWWNAQEPPPGCQWRTMEHAGVSFPEPYEPHGVCLLYDGEPVKLSPVEEEAATFFAAMDPEGMHLGNPKTAKIFNKNFFADFRAVLGKGHTIKVSVYDSAKFDLMCFIEGIQEM